MLALQFILALALFLIHSSEGQDPETTLEYVFIIQRNSRRSPGFEYPRNQIKAAYWNRYQGLNQLTAKGMEDSRNFGISQRVYYADFLPEKYQEGVALSATAEGSRYIQSTLAFFSGLFKPFGAQVWDQQLDWMPIPPTILTNTLSSVIKEGKCPKYDSLIEADKNSDYYQNFLKKHQNFLKQLSKKTGINEITLEDVSDLADTLISEIQEGLEISPWLKVNLKKILKIHQFVLDFENGRNIEIAKMRSGHLLQNTIDDFIDIRKGKPVNKLVSYTTGDNEFGSFLALLKNPNEMLPVLEFTSALFLELRKDKSNGYYVKTVFKNNPPTKENTFEDFIIHGCDKALCKLSVVLKQLKDKLASDPESECNKA